MHSSYESNDPSFNENENEPENGIHYGLAIAGGIIIAIIASAFIIISLMNNT